MPAEADLVGFVYGEECEEGSGRSLGYRLLGPWTQTWGAEVEALARRLQAAPYPEHWPATDLFCSVVLAGGQRLIGLARYGLLDHTPSQRRGGLELVGVVGAGGLEASTALTVYRWLGQRRAGEDDIRRLAGTYRLADILAEAPAGGVVATDGAAGPLPVLPVRLWQDGAFLFAAGSPSDPDHHLRLLETVAGPGWQWLPLVGTDFPLSAYAQRGPLVAWTPHLAGVALKLDRKPAERLSLPGRRWRAARLATAVLLLVIAGLLGGNLWALRDLHRRLADLPAAPAPSPPTQALPSTTAREPDASRERFARALYRLLAERGGEREWNHRDGWLLNRYEELARHHPDLRLRPDNTRGRKAVAVAAVLAGRSADRVEETVRKGLSDRGLSKKFVEAACEQVREQFGAEFRER
jgi:hypothetical protein